MSLDIEVNNIVGLQYSNRLTNFATFLSTWFGNLLIEIRLTPPIESAAIPVTMPATTAETLSFVSRTVTVAPLVLLSAADHFGRVNKGQESV